MPFTRPHVRTVGLAPFLGGLALFLHVAALPVVAQDVLPPQPAQTHSNLSDIRRMNELLRKQREDFLKQVDEVNTLIANMEDLAFQVELRIARIRAGQYERDCTGTEKEAATLDKALAKVFAMRQTANRLCQSGGQNEAVQSICTGRHTALANRETELRTLRTQLARACPKQVPPLQGGKP